MDIIKDSTIGTLAVGATFNSMETPLTQGHEYVLTVNGAIGGSDSKTFTVPGVCSVELKKATAVNGTPVDTCGPTMNADITPANTEGVDYIKAVSGNTVTLTAKAKAGYELTNPDFKQVYTDKLVACSTGGGTTNPPTNRAGGSGLGPDQDETGFPSGLLGLGLLGLGLLGLWRREAEG